MKRIFIAIFLIAVSVFIGIYSLNKTTRICSNMISQLEKTTKEVIDIKENSSHDKRIGLYKSTQGLNDAWEENAAFLYFFFDTNSIKNIETSIEKTPLHVKNGDLEATYLCLVECLEELEFIKSSVTIDIENIF